MSKDLWVGMHPLLNQCNECLRKTFRWHRMCEQLHSACHPLGVTLLLLLAVQLMHCMSSSAHAGALIFLKACSNPQGRCWQQQERCLQQEGGPPGASASSVSCRSTPAAELAGRQQQKWQAVSSRSGKPSASATEMASRQ